MTEINKEDVALKPQQIRERRPKRGRYDDELDAAERLTKLYRMERYVYLFCCCVAIALLVFCAYRLVNKDPNDPADIPALTALFGSGGIFGYTIHRVIFMWNKIIDLILAGKEKTKE